MTPHEGVWSNGGFAFFYDDPTFDCVFKLSKATPLAESGLLVVPQLTKPYPGYSGAGPPGVQLRHDFGTSG